MLFQTPTQTAGVCSIHNWGFDFLQFTAGIAECVRSCRMRTNWPDRGRLLAADGRGALAPRMQPRVARRSIESRLVSDLDRNSLMRAEETIRQTITADLYAYWSRIRGPHAAPRRADINR